MFVACVFHMLRHLLENVIVNFRLFVFLTHICVYICVYIVYIYVYRRFRRPVTQDCSEIIDQYAWVCEGK